MNSQTALTIMKQENIYMTVYIIHVNIHVSTIIALVS